MREASQVRLYSLFEMLFWTDRPVGWIFSRRVLSRREHHCCKKEENRLPELVRQCTAQAAQ
jgi:hypothetical protein